MKKLAEDNYAFNRAYEYFVENVDKEKVIEIAGRLYISWENANLNGYIDEKYDSFDEWLNDYGMSVALDSISMMKDDDSFGSLYSAIEFTDKNEFDDKIFEFIKSISNEIESGINEQSH